MKKWLSSLCLAALLGFSGCASADFNKAATDVALTGTGGVLGYKLSDGNPGATAAGAAAGYLVSKVAQSSYQRSLNEAEKAGYDRAMNQAVKQHYWMMQNQQKTVAPEGERDASLVPLVIPETNLNGVIVNPRVEYVRITP